MLQAKLTSLDSGTSVIVTKSLYLDLQHASNVSAAAVSEAAALRADLAAQGTQRDARLADLEHQFAELKAKVRAQMPGPVASFSVLFRSMLVYGMPACHRIPGIGYVHACHAFHDRGC